MSRTHAVAVFLAAVAAASPALAQDAATARPMTFGVSGGLSMPLGDFGDVVKSGFNVGAHLAFKPATLPVGIRVEGQFNRFGLDVEGGDVLGIETDGNVQIISGTANAVFGVPAASSAFRPYLIGGVGLYNLKGSGSISFGGVTESGSDSETKFGLNGGAGIEFGLSGLATFVEARFHSVFTEDSKTNFVPISFGIKF
jgi:opacity protein-like surface antigen